MKGLNWTLGGLASFVALLVLAGCSGAGANAGVGGATTTVYAGGYSMTGAGVEAPGYWENGTWEALPSPNGSSNSAQVNAIAVSDSNLYAGGVSYAGSSGSSTLQVPGYWKDGSWVGLTNSYGSSYDAYVTSLVVSGSNVYAGGYSYNGASAGVEIPGYWKDGTWVGLVNPLGSSYNASVDTVAISGTDVYAGGDCSNGSGTSAISEPGYWKNGTWVALPLPSWAASNGGYVNSLVVAGTEVYVGGSSLSTPSTPQVPGYWLDGTWVGLPALSSSHSADVSSMVVSTTGVYAGGASTNASGDEIPGYWKDGTWNALANPYDQNNGSIIYPADVTSLAVSGTDVYAGGFSQNSSGDYVPGYWKNGAWVRLPSLSSYGGEVLSIVVN